MHPTPEQIKSMLIYEAPTPVQEVVNHYRVLLEENKALKESAEYAVRNLNSFQELMKFDKRSWSFRKVNQIAEVLTEVTL